MRLEREPVSSCPERRFARSRAVLIAKCRSVSNRNNRDQKHTQSRIVLVAKSKCRAVSQSVAQVDGQSGSVARDLDALDRRRDHGVPAGLAAAEEEANLLKNLRDTKPTRCRPAYVFGGRKGPARSFFGRVSQNGRTMPRIKPRRPYGHGPCLSSCRAFRSSRPRIVQEVDQDRAIEAFLFGLVDCT